MRPQCRAECAQFVGPRRYRPSAMERCSVCNHQEQRVASARARRMANHACQRARTSGAICAWRGTTAVVPSSLSKRVRFTRTVTRDRRIWTRAIETSHACPPTRSQHNQRDCPHTSAIRPNTYASRRGRWRPGARALRSAWRTLRCGGGGAGCSWACCSDAWSGACWPNGRACGGSSGPA